MTWPFGDLKTFGYGTILADPPWLYENYSEKGEAKSPNAHYECVPVEVLAERFPVGHLAAPDCALFMWATAPMLPQALWLMKQWGFTYKTMGAWAKRSRADATWAFGTGYIYRSALEPYIVGTIGAPKVRNRSVRNLIVEPVREHSRKPTAMYEQIEALYHGPRAELFARTERSGWDCWGNQTERFTD